MRFVFVTLDGKAYADAHGVDPASWSPLSRDDKAVRDSRRRWACATRRTVAGGFDHSATLLDEGGEMVMQKPDIQVDPQDFAPRIPR